MNKNSKKIAESNVFATKKGLFKCEIKRNNIGVQIGCLHVVSIPDF